MKIAIEIFNCCAALVLMIVTVIISAG